MYLHVHYSAGRWSRVNLILEKIQKLRQTLGYLLFVLEHDGVVKITESGFAIPRKVLKMLRENTFWDDVNRAVLAYDDGR